MLTSQVHYFLALCAERNFTRAAARCGVSQPSLTIAIKKLERGLGGALFHRKWGRIELTELGRAVRPSLAKLEKYAVEAERKAAMILGGTKSRHKRRKAHSL